MILGIYGESSDPNPPPSQPKPQIDVHPLVTPTSPEKKEIARIVEQAKNLEKEKRDGNQKGK
jgi:hypothetical protein